ncbi:rRNA processing protein [Coniosporium tulheliwenetii]|uniref:rRNA processing protein n=1 Tax=Coniosporium tulheliwenetii TaxID=3383036 RepID=A0ACC2YJD5_9PEZI|nr:rRNA processing protein [Cladosporium sp. JES 115]
MAKSAKHKKEKKKDFQKPKLKIGKAKPKAANFTDTSFKAKSIVLAQQSILAAAPSTTTQFSHHLSMLSHKSDTQVKESLAYLTTALSTKPADASLPQPITLILSKVQPLVHSASHGVRQQLLKLLQSLPPAELPGHTDQLLLWTRAGMTHLSTDIRSTSLDILEWLLQAAGDDVVSCAGGWFKTLKTFLGLLGWAPRVDTDSHWTSNRASLGKASDAKAQGRTLMALAALLRAGLAPPKMQARMLGRGGFAHLNLFGPPRDEESEMYEDREDRQRIFHERFQSAITAGLEQAKKEGGEVGRAVAAVRRAMSEGMADYGD